MERFSRTGVLIAVVVSTDEKVLGTVTDGDIRKDYLRGWMSNQNVRFA